MSRSPLLLGTGGERERATRVGVARICIGGSMLLTTGLGRRVFGIPAEQDRGGGLRLAARLFGIRNVVLGGWVVARPSPRTGAMNNIRNHNSCHVPFLGVPDQPRAVPAPGGRKRLTTGIRRSRPNARAVIFTPGGA
jgi:hypothetical protein